MAQPVTRPNPFCEGKKKKGKEMKRDPDNSPGLARLPAGEATDALPLPPLKPERREGDPLT